MGLNNRSLLLASSLFLACGPGPTPGETPTITATGSGQVSLPPDQATASISVQTRATTAAVAASQNSGRVESVLKALRASGLVDSLKVTYVSVSPNDDDTGRQIDFGADAGISFRIQHVDSVGPALDLAVRAGATSVATVAFESDSTGAGRRAALAKAFEAARQDAEALAGSSGNALGTLVGLSTERGGPAMYYESASVTSVRGTNSYANASSGLVSIGPTPRRITINASATATWLLIVPHK